MMRYVLMIKYIISMGEYELCVGVQSGIDMDGTFSAYCYEEKENILINGWLIDQIQQINGEL